MQDDVAICHDGPDKFMIAVKLGVNFRGVSYFNLRGLH